MIRSRALVCSLSFLSLAVGLASQGCSDDDDSAGSTPTAGAAAGGDPGVAPQAGKGGMPTGAAGTTGTAGTKLVGESGTGTMSGGNATGGEASDAGGALGTVGGAPTAVSGGAGGEGGATTSLAMIATIPAAGGDVPVTLPGGQVVTFTFPASAAGKQITLTPTTASSIGWPDGQFDDVITMEPAGTTFPDPVIVRLAKKDLIVLDFPTSGTKSGAVGLALNAAGDGLELKHFSTLAVVPTGKSCDSSSGWHEATDDARCSAFGAATSYLDFACKGYNFCQIIQAHCCAAPGATECQTGDADVAITYTDSDGNGTYAYCKQSLSTLTPNSGAVGATISAAGQGWDTYLAQDAATHFITGFHFKQSGADVFPQPNVPLTATPNAQNPNLATFIVPNVPAGLYDVSLSFRNGITTSSLPFTVTQ